MRVLFILSLIATLLLSMTFVIAENAVQGELTEQTVDKETVAEINDELNESVSSINEGLTRLQLWLTLKQEKKAELELKLARLELIKARIAAKNNNTIAMEKALEAHNRIMARIQERINALDGDTTKERIRKTAEKLVGLERAIEVHEAKIARLREILINENLTEEQIANIQVRIEKAENVTAHLKEVQEMKKNRLRTRLMAVVNMTQDEANAEIEKIEEATNLSAVKKLVAEVKATRTEKAAQVVTKVIEKLETKQNETNKNISNRIENLIQVQQRLQERAGEFRKK